MRGFEVEVVTERGIFSVTITIFTKRARHTVVQSLTW